MWICPDVHEILANKAFTVVQHNLVCENWSTGCEDTSWMKFVTHWMEFVTDLYIYINAAYMLLIHITLYIAFVLIDDICLTHCEYCITWTLVSGIFYNKLFTLYCYALFLLSLYQKQVQGQYLGKINENR